MQIATGSIWNPVGFNPLDYLPPDLYPYADEARYLVHLVYSRFLSDKRYRKQVFAPIKREYASRFFSSNYIYGKIRKSLLDNFVILCDNYYIEGEKSYGYCLGPRWANLKFEKVEVRSKKLRGKILKDKKSLVLRTKAARYLQRNLQQLKIDKDAALAHIEQNPEITEKNIAETLVEMIDDICFFYKLCSYGRFHSSITNLPGSLRQFLLINGRKLVNLDVRNSQPLLFNLTLHANLALLPNPLLKPSTATSTYFAQNIAPDTFPAKFPVDVAVYQDLTQKGQFYEFLMDFGGYKASERERFKEVFFERVFYCKNTPIYKEAEIFRELFPNIFFVIQKIKEQDYKKMAHLLQKAESALIIETIIQRCMVELPDAWVNTIHDSILTLPEHADKIRAIMLEEFQKKNLFPTIKTESY